MTNIIVKALPWHENAPRDGTWWIGYEEGENHALICPRDSGFWPPEGD